MEEGNSKLYGTWSSNFFLKQIPHKVDLSLSSAWFHILDGFQTSLGGFIRQQNWTQWIQSSNKLVHLVPGPCVTAECLSSASPASWGIPLSPDKRRKTPTWHQDRNSPSSEYTYSLGFPCLLTLPGGQFFLPWFTLREFTLKERSWSNMESPATC